MITFISTNAASLNYISLILHEQREALTMAPLQASTSSAANSNKVANAAKISLAKVKEKLIPLSKRFFTNESHNMETNKNSREIISYLNEPRANIADFLSRLKLQGIISQCKQLVPSGYSTSGIAIV